MPFSIDQRRAALEQIDGDRLFDLAVIGAGITGASVARDAAMRGYSVAVVDGQDFGGGTSSRSSRLIHGGLRYLEHAEFGLVFESLAERALLARLARHVVRPLHFVFPVFRGDRRGLLLANIGIWLYDLLAVGRNYRWHARLSPGEVRDVFPALRDEGLRGAVAFYDYQTDDARLVLENILSAVGAGAVAIPHASVERVETGGPVKLLTLRDGLTGARHQLSARAVISATGPWTDRLLGRLDDQRRGDGQRRGPAWLRPTKGVHLVVPGSRLRIDSAMAMQHPLDGRAIFALPYHERTVIGTTDTDFDGDPAAVNATFEDVNYLLVAMAHYFPHAGLTDDDVISTWAGVRPLLGEEDIAASAVSREHRISVRGDGVVVIAGGKLTTYRRMAAECVERTVEVIAVAGGPLPAPPSPTDRRPLVGAVGLDSDVAFEALIARLATIVPQPVAAQLATSYGVRALEVVDLTLEDPALGERIVEDLPFIWAQVVHAAREEMALTLDDALVRRIQLFYRDRDQGLSAAPRAAALMARELGWDGEQERRQVERYRQLVARNRAWRSPTSDDAGEPIDYTTKSTI